MKGYALGMTLLSLSIGLTACGPFGEDTENQSFDNDEISSVDGEEGKYVDPKLSLCTEIRGSYKSDRPFTLDPTNENIRVWDDLYLYEYDYFQLIAVGTSAIYYQVDEASTQFVEYNGTRPQATIKAGESGIYTLSFDIESKLFHLEFKEEIITPVYEKMNGCDVYSLSHDGFMELTPNPDNEEELMISNYSVEMGEYISFYEHGDYHLSNYKVVPDSSLLRKLISGIDDGDANPGIMIGGNYNLYINPTTYAFRAELLNPDEATYSLLTIEGEDYVAISHEVGDPSYLYRLQFTVEREYQSMPLLFNEKYQMFELDVVPNDSVTSYGQFKIPGLYALEINLKEFTIEATYLPQ